MIPFQEDGTDISCKPKGLLGKQVSLRHTLLLSWCLFYPVGVHINDVSDHILIANILGPKDLVSNFDC